MRLARALAARGRMVLEARIRALVVGIRPLGLVRIAHRVVERVVRLGVLRAVPRPERLALLVAHWSGAAAEMSASVESGSRSTARSPSEMMPTGRPFFTTGSRR